MRVGPFVWALLAAALFGASTPASKALSGDLGPVTLAGLLYLGAALAVLPRARGIPRAALRDGRTLRRLGGAVLFGGVIGPVLMLVGLTMASASAVSIWLSLETVFTAVLARFFFREHLGPRTAVALALIMISSALLTSPSIEALTPAALLVAGACLAWGLDNNLMSVVDGVSPAHSTLAKGLIAGTANVTLGVLIEGVPDVGLLTIGAALLVGAFGYGISLVLYVAASQQLGATRSQAVFSSAPFWGLAAAWLVLGEPITRVSVVAGVLLALALALLPRERHAHGHFHHRMEHAHWHRHDDGHHAHAHADERTGRFGWHFHSHAHDPHEHEHEHEPDLHHRHEHE